jgi:signal transduction histidine kinase
MASRFHSSPHEETPWTSVRDMAEALTHELRSPLNAIVGSISLLERGAAEHSADRVHLERLKRNSRHLAGILDDVMDLLRADTLTFEVSPAMHRLCPAVEDSLAIVDLLACGRRVSIVNTLANAGCGPWYWGDERRVRQIVVNLTTNAIKFTEPGGRVEVIGGTLTHVPEAPSSDRAWTFLRIHDTGRGIPSGRYASVFEPFQQVEAADRLRGQGLGLSISRRLARAMGGDITVVSEVGVGSAFTLWLPTERDARDTSLPFPREPAVLSWSQPGTSGGLSFEDERNLTRR